MTDKTSVLCIDELDLRHVATILKRVFPHFSLCECARMTAEFAPEAGSVCSLCKPGTYPDCVRSRKNATRASHHYRA